MDPFSIIYLVFTVAAMAASGYASYQQNVAAKAQASAQKKIGEYNAKQAQKKAQQERLDRDAAEKEERKENRRRLASIENMYAASGVLIDGTSAVDALAAQSAADELNVLNRNRESENRARSLESQGKIGLWESNIKAQSYKMQGRAALVDGAADVFGLAAGAAGKIAESRKAADAGGGKQNNSLFSGLFGKK